RFSGRPPPSSTRFPYTTLFRSFVDGRCRRIVAAPAEERLLIGVAKRRERRSLRRAVHVAVGSRDAESQAAQREALGCAERLNEQARGVVARSVDLCVALCIAGASVDDAVVDAQRILQALAERFACELQAQIAVGNERSRKPALYESHIIGGDETLEADRNLELAHGERRPRPQPNGAVSIEYDRPAAGEIGRQPEIERVV